ncbi:unnamed protein product [Schistosoma margrebowiei]|uniref:Uncharacterized protein n=1 Tax=Schistosoma margrebowiei TaxID=48269 RepID=A0A183MQI4_9TREM|nr:unnamed protein product [Schistosoma margrebowiei]
MKTSTSDGKHGIQRTAQLGDLDFTNLPDLLSHTHEQMQINMKSVAAVSSAVDFNMHKGNKKHPQIQQREHQPNQAHLMEKLCNR